MISTEKADPISSSSSSKRGLGSDNGDSKHAAKRLRAQPCAATSIVEGSNDSPSSSAKHTNIGNWIHIDDSDSDIEVISPPLPISSKSFEQRSLPDSDGNGTSESAQITAVPRTDIPLRSFADTVRTPASLPKTTGATCFGVLIMTITSSSNLGRSERVVSVDVSPFGDVLKLAHRKSKKYLGLLPIPTLRNLVEDFHVQYTGTIPLHETMSAKSAKEYRQPKWISVETPQTLPLRLVVFGSMSDALAVGKALSEASLFLQQPFFEECGPETRYHNPHYFLRPGASMPKLVESMEACALENRPVPDTIDEVSKNTFMRLFDDAYDGGGTTPQLEPSPRLLSTLKPHQLVALAMMLEKESGIVDEPIFPPIWELVQGSDGTKRYRHTITGSFEKAPIPVNGGILADDMGIGKTLSLLALICSGLDRSESLSRTGDKKTVVGTLIVAPKSTIPGWQQQIERHIQHGKLRVDVYHGANRRHLSDTLNDYDIIITTYETLRADRDNNGALYRHNWLRVALDEAHHIRNRTSNVFHAVCSLQCQYRWCLTGTPIHNSLDDYGALLSFIRVASLTQKAQFDRWITSPTRNDRKESYIALRYLIKATCLRRTKLAVDGFLKLPPRIEKVERITLKDAELALYSFFRGKVEAAAKENPKSRINTSAKASNVIPMLNLLRRLCDHGIQLLPPNARKSWEERHDTSLDDTAEHDLAQHTQFTDDWDQTNGQLDNSVSEDIAPSSKVEALLHNVLSELEQPVQNDKRPHKSVIFSSWTKMLDLTQRVFTLCGFSYVRIDGGSSLKERASALLRFNDDPECTILFASITSAGEGLNLTVANNVHLVEPHWNPQVEAQAIDRIHRIGQDRKVNVTRYIVQNTIEEHVRWVQQQKQRLVTRSLESDGVFQSDIEDERRKRLHRCLAGERS